MDAPAMLTRKHVPEDVGLRNTGEDEAAAAGGQGQMHRDEKQHKPVLKKVKEKVKKIKSTLAGSHGHDHGGDGRAGAGHDAAGSTSSEEAEEDAAEREAALEKGGYLEDVEDKPVLTESDPEVHGAPMYESERAQPAVQDLVAKYDPARAPAVREREGDGGAPGVRFGDLGGPGFESPAAPLSPAPSPATTPAAVQEAAEGGTAPGVRLGDLGGHVVEDPAAPRSTTPAAREGEDIGTTPVVQQFETMNLSDDHPAHVGAGKKGDAKAAEWKDAAADKMGGGGGGGGASYTDKLRSAAAGTTEYGKKLATTVYEKLAGAGTAVTAGKRDGGERTETAPAPAPTPASNAATTQELKNDAPVATDATNGSSGAGYTDKIKSAAAGTAGYGKQLASTAYEKVAGAGTAVAGKVQQATLSAGTATPGVGAQQQQQDTSAGGQDKGVTVTGYIAEKLRPGEEDRALSEAISGAVQRRKEDAGGTVAQRVPAPGQVVAKAREAVASLTGGNRVSETVQPSAATGEEVKEGYGAEAPVIHGEEIGGARLNTNTM
ncbi:unnamed protein product [Urochloa humidicola]